MLCRILTFLLAFSALPAIAQAPELNTLLHDIWEDRLKRSPVFASEIGDFRYNDQLPDLSPRAVNDRLAAEHGFLIRLLAIDTTTISAQDRLLADQLQRELLHDEEAAPFKQWELPITQSHGIQTGLSAMADELLFSTVKDFDDYIARLHLVPRQLRQASENLLSGIDDQRVQPAGLLERALAQTEELASQPAADSPFARPLKRFPATIDAAQQKRISAAVLDAIQTDVLPACVRFAKFLRVTEIPAAPKDASSLPDHTLSNETDQSDILELRDKAKAALGPKFDLKAFHDVIANSNGLPTAALDQRVNAWIVTTK